ncbi:hypothetical protein L3V82_04025 [Thiotrichales bacterium 19S3-7]|nr:hypothetical protein [Thiotrichales bacterium 19S3-7]MCF6801842.1 hypothetical protein [Thiotrichales bacterium 19S3-11]
MEFKSIKELIEYLISNKKNSLYQMVYNAINDNQLGLSDMINTMLKFTDNELKLTLGAVIELYKLRNPNEKIFSNLEDVNNYLRDTEIYNILNSSSEILNAVSSTENKTIFNANETPPISESFYIDLLKLFVEEKNCVLMNSVIQVYKKYYPYEYSVDTMNENYFTFYNQTQNDDFNGFEDLSKDSDYIRFQGQ